nr:hypothetical protein [Tanacetum cinerariifolium]
MARLAFCDYHNMIAILEKIKTTEEGTKILATVDGNLKTISESSIRRNIKLNDEARISSLTDAELFENLTLMGYNISPNQKFTFQKGQFFHQWKYLIHTIMHCLSPKSNGFNEFSSNIATALVCLATNRVYNFSKMIFDGMVRNVNNKVSKFLMYLRVKAQELQLSPITYPPLRHNKHHLLLIPHHHFHLFQHQSLPTVIPTDTLPLRHYTRRARIAQSLALLPIADEPASPVGDVSQGKACPTNPGLEANQDRADIPKTSTLPSDSTPTVTSLAADEGSMQQKLDELTALCTSLQRKQSEMVSKFEAQELEIKSLKARIKLLEDKDRGVADQSEDDAPIKGGGWIKGRKQLKDGGFQVVPTAIEVATATISIPTGSGVVSTASPTFPTAALIFTTATDSTPYTRRKGKEKMVESDTPKKKKLQEQIDVQTQQRKSITRKQQREFYTSVLSNQAGWKAKHFKGMTLEEIKEKFDLVWKQIQDFIPIGSKEESERLKRKGIRFEQDSAKKQKTSEEVPKEKLKEMIELIPVEEVYVEALQVKHPITDWKHFDREDLNQLWALVKESLSNKSATSDREKELWLYDTCGVHHVSTKDQDIFMLIEKDYPLRKGLAIVMISYKLQVENYSQMASDLILKIHKIANRPRQEDD